MAFASLNLAERYRPWQESGLHFLLRSEKQLATDEEEPQLQPHTESSRIAEDVSVSRETQQATPSAHHDSSILDHDPNTAQHTTSQQSSVPEYISPDSPWPHPWDSYAEKLPQSPSFIWTYWELGLDMAGRSSGKRRTILQKLLLSVNLPSGTIGFWPAAALHGDELLFDEQLFFRGLAQSGVSDVLCFGPELYGRLFPGEVYAPRPREAHGYTFYFLPPIRENLADNRSALDALLSRVRTALRIES